MMICQKIINRMGGYERNEKISGRWQDRRRGGGSIGDELAGGSELVRG